VLSYHYILYWKHALLVIRILVKRVALYLSMGNKNLTVRFGRGELKRYWVAFSIHTTQICAQEAKTFVKQ